MPNTLKARAKSIYHLDFNFKCSDIIWEKNNIMYYIIKAYNIIHEQNY